MSRIDNDGEVCEMQNAETVLEIIRERGKKGLPLERRLPMLVQPGPVPACLRQDLPQRRGDDPWSHAGRPWTA